MGTDCRWLTVSKTSSIGDQFYIAGFDLSGDVASLDQISSPQGTFDVTSINKGAHERIGGQRDGGFQFTTYFNPSSGHEHAALSTLPTADVVASYLHGTTLGNAAACLVAKQVNYDWTRPNDGSLTGKVSLVANAFGLEWGEQLTAGLRTDSTATTGAFFDDGAASSFGGQAYFQLTAFSGTSVTIDIQSATSSGGTYSSTGLTSSALTAVGAQRVAVANTTTINEFIKVVTTGTFSNAVFSVVFVRNPVAGIVF